MPEFEINPSNLRRHKKKKKQTNKQTKVTEQNSPTFALKLDFIAFASIRKTLNRALKKQTDQETFRKFPLCVTGHVDKQSSRIG